VPPPERLSSGAEQTRVLVVEDHGLLAQSLRLALTAEGMAVTVPAVDFASVVAAAESSRPHVALLDLDLGESGADGVDLVQALVVLGARVLVVTGSSDRARHGRCLELGAAAVLTKNDALEVLLVAVHAAVAGEPVVSAAARYELLAEGRALRTRRQEQLAPFEQLTERECAVFGAVIEGLSAADIAAREYVSEATVRSQIRSVLTKLGVNSQLAAVAKARQADWSLRTEAAAR
jgi:two-component system nitrate/nitrite response regulator NarL